jgi:hypothetical protein
MSTWMSIGFDPNQMDPATDPYALPSTGEARDDAAPRLTGGLDQAPPGEFGAVSHPRGSRTDWIAGGIKNLVGRYPTLRVLEWRPR